MQTAATDALASLGKGNSLMQAERYDDAAVQFRHALELDQSLTEARKNLAICHFQLRDYDAARSGFESLSTGNQRALAAYYLGRLDLVKGNFDSTIHRLLSTRAESGSEDLGYYLGVAYFKKGGFALAISTLRNYLHTNPRDFRAHQWLARALSKTGNKEEADKEFARTRELHDYYTDGSVLLGNCRALLNEHKTEDAWQMCEPMLNTDDPDKAAAVGMLFGKAGDNIHALACWQEALLLDPESPEINYDMAIAYFQTRDIPHAAQYARMARDLWPRFPEANILYGTTLYMLKQDSEAIKVLTDAHALRPDDENVTRLLSELNSHSKN